MDKSQRQNGKLKKGFKKLPTTNNKKSCGQPKNSETSAVIPNDYMVEVSAIPLSNYMFMYRRLLYFLRPNSKNIRIMHRDYEREVLLEFIKQSFDVNNLPINKKIHPSVMIVFGQAGLGKTLLLQDILKDLHQSLVCDLLGPNKSVANNVRISVFYFNSMDYDYPKDLLLRILQAVFKDHLKIDKDEDADYYLQAFRTKIKKVLLQNFIIVLIDELDHLYYKCPASFYSLIEFFNIYYPGIVKIGISNTLNFVSHVSGMYTLLNIKFLIFKPYTVIQLKDILLDRITSATKDSDVSWMELMTPSAIELLVKKTISNNSSDVRFLLSCITEIIINKIDILRKENRKRHKIPDIQQINPMEILALVKNKMARKFADLIKSFSFQQQLILVALCTLLNNESVFVDKNRVKSYYKKMLKAFDIDDRIEFEVLLDNLVGYSFIKLLKDSSKVIIQSELSKRELVAYLNEISILKKELEKMY